MNGIAQCLPKPAVVRDDIGFVVHALSNVFLHTRKFAGRTLWSRLSSNFFQLIKPSLQIIDLGQQRVLRKLGLALEFMGKLREARFEAVGFLKFTNTLGKFTNTRI